MKIYKTLAVVTLTFMISFCVNGKPVDSGGDGKQTSNDNTGSNQMSEDELMTLIEETRKNNDKQRDFWDAELKEMNYWLRL